MSEAYLFLMLHGVFTSVSLHLSQLASKGSCLAFPPIQSIWGLLDLRLFWAVVVTGTALRTVDQLAVQMRGYFLTKGQRFPVMPRCDAEKPMQLSTAMASRGCAFVQKLMCLLPVQYLSFQDFRHLAEHSQARRAQVFAVSTPGCHPLHWGALCEACLALVRQISYGLANLDVPPPKQPSNPPPATPQGQ
ncbi:hypothetical protein HPB50_009037 [Hyalomma asiaticum]|uniref:Uncharacterized protein n=1 Tax=Hyalomma asiaticum TaxID=266040 RepID=A0ACB7T0V6_HYAAI|nr:hypothetical protein HPB50_009037 [Hyalomma asiaticum]